jgi:hypothetical protein
MNKTKPKNKMLLTCSNCKSSTVSGVRTGCYFGGRFRGWLPNGRVAEQAICETNNYLIAFRGCRWEGEQPPMQRVR